MITPTNLPFSGLPLGVAFIPSSMWPVFIPIGIIIVIVMASFQVIQTSNHNNPCYRFLVSFLCFLFSFMLFLFCPVSFYSVYCLFDNTLPFTTFTLWPI